MTEIVELVYASRANFVPTSGFGAIEPEVGRILVESRRNNRRQNVGGVLCYSDGCFLQCLEGETAEVDAIYKRIARDSRHRDVKILSRRIVPHRRFRTWSMKYALVDDTVRQLVGPGAFQPHQFSDDVVRTLVRNLHAAVDMDQAKRPKPSPATKATPRPRSRSSLLVGAALSVAVSALAVALVSLYRTLG